MSRFREGDEAETPEEVLAYGQWANNARRVLKSRRGRKALAELREALLALPQKRLISGALCITGDVDAALPEIADEEIAADLAAKEAWRAGNDLPPVDAEYATWHAQWMREAREEDREQYANRVRAQGSGVCANGALLWHRKVRDGMDPGEAFAALPLIVDGIGDEDPMDETAHAAANGAGIAFTLAWELAYRNDETYERMTPEERYTAFLAWLDRELASDVAAA